MLYLRATFAALLLAVNVAAFNQLSLSGGGAFGAVEIGILKRLIEDGQISGFDQYTGVSAGALNAGFLSYFKNLKQGVAEGELLYSTMRNRLVYSLEPSTGVSLLNTTPLRETLTMVLGKMRGEPVIPTLIGTTNMYSGALDTYRFDELSDADDRVTLLMCSSAIPVVFPPIDFRGAQYTDGGTLSNELLDVTHSAGFQNITLITPFEGYLYNDAPITTLEEAVIRAAQVVFAGFDNALTKLPQTCDTPYGELTAWFVPSDALDGFSMLNFDKGAELVQVGYERLQSKKYRLC